MSTRSTEWWLTQAAKVTGGKCLKCGHHTDGVYVPPGRGTVLECAIVESCRMCGWEITLVRGMAGELVESMPRSSVKRVGVAGVKNPPGYDHREGSRRFRQRQRGMIRARRKA